MQNHAEKEEVSKFVRRYLRKMYMDLVGPTVEDDQGNTGAAVLRDHDTGWPEFIPINDKTPETVLTFWMELFPGIVAQGTHPEDVYCDNGGEFKGVYEEHVIDAAIRNAAVRMKENSRPRSDRPPLQGFQYALQHEAQRGQRRPRADGRWARPVPWKAQTQESQACQTCSQSKTENRKQNRIVTVAESISTQRYEIPR